MKTVLVTGGAGFISSNTCKALDPAGFLPIIRRLRADPKFVSRHWPLQLSAMEFPGSRADFGHGGSRRAVLSHRAGPAKEPVQSRVGPPRSLRRSPCVCDPYLARIRMVLREYGNQALMRLRVKVYGRSCSRYHTGSTGDWCTILSLGHGGPTLGGDLDRRTPRPGPPTPRPRSAQGATRTGDQGRERS